MSLPIPLPVGDPTPPAPQSATSQSPMANLMSITETLPPGSPRNGSSPPGPQLPPPRTASRGSQHSPNSSGTLIQIQSIQNQHNISLDEYMCYDISPSESVIHSFHLSFSCIFSIFSFPIICWNFLFFFVFSFEKELLEIWLICVLSLTFTDRLKRTSIIWFTACFKYNSDIIWSTATECTRQFARHSNSSQQCIES